MKKPVIFYHLWRGVNWKKINERVFTKLVQSGLIDYCDTINICINDNGDFNDIDLHGIPEDKVVFRSVDNTQTEWPTINELFREYVDQEDVPLLYLHSKGASYTESDHRYEGVISWVDGLLYYLVEDWRTCLSKMRMGCDTVGANKRKDPVIHFSGNFWWIKSDVLKELPDPSFQDHSFNNRYGAEFWIGNLGSARLTNNGLVGFDYLKNIPRNLYDKPLKISRTHKSICLHYDTQLDLTAFNNSGLSYEVYTNQYNSYSISYLTYIYDNYENLPDYVYFIRTSQIIEHSPNLFDIVESNNSKEYEPLSKLMISCDSNGNPHHPGLKIDTFYKELFACDNAPEIYNFGAGAQFKVAKEVILKHPKYFYSFLLNIISKTINPVEDFILERLWAYIFDGEREAIQRLNDFSNFDITVFIFNYGLMDNAIKLRNQFNEIGVKALILDSFSGQKPPNEEYIHGFDNVYYSGLWNEALNLCTSKHMMILTSDVSIDDASKIITRSHNFFKLDSAGIYAPNVNYSFWNYNTELLEDYGNGMKIVPNTDGMCWIIKSDIAKLIGHIDNSINKIGFGVDLLAAMFAKKQNKLVCRDYSVTVKHPQTRSYDSQEAEKQEFEWISSLGVLTEYKQYRNYYCMSYLK